MNNPTAGALRLARRICSFDPHPDRIYHVALEIDAGIDDLVQNLRDVERSTLDGVIRQKVRKTLRGWRLG